MNRFEKMNAAPVTVSHADLKRFSDESPYRSYCPVCETGVLLVNRDQQTFVLINVDRCTYCAQTIIYSDKAIAGEPVMDIRASAGDPSHPTAWDHVLDSERLKPN